MYPLHIDRENTQGWEKEERRVGDGANFRIVSKKCDSFSFVFLACEAREIERPWPGDERYM